MGKAQNTTGISHNYPDEIYKQLVIFRKNYEAFFNFIEEYKVEELDEFFNYYINHCFKLYLKKTNESLYNDLIRRTNLGDYFDDEAFKTILILYQNVNKIIKDNLLASKFRGKGSRLTDEAITLYYRVFEIYDAKLKSNKKPKWSQVFKWSAKKHYKNDKLLGSEDNIKKQLKAFYKFRRENNLNSLKDYENYLENNNYNTKKD